MVLTVLRSGVEGAGKVTVQGLGIFQVLGVSRPLGLGIPVKEELGRGCLLLRLKLQALRRTYE